MAPKSWQSWLGLCQVGTIGWVINQQTQLRASPCTMCFWLSLHLITGWWLTYPSEKKMMSSSVGMMTFPVFLGSHKIPWFQSPPTSITFRDFDGTFVDSWPHGNLGADSQSVPRSVDQEIKFPCEVQWIYRWESPNWNVVVVVDLVRGFTHWKWWIFP